MNGNMISVPASDGGAFRAYLTLPPNAPARGIVMVHEIFGLNRTIRKLGDMFTAKGYVVLAPDLFWRLAKNVELDYTDEDRPTARGLNRRFDYEAGVRDMTACVEMLRGMDVCNGSVVATGFCLGGNMAYLAAARCPVDAAVAYYGTDIQHFLGDVSRIDCPLILHIGEKDHTTPPDAIRSILAAVESNPNIVAHVYEGAPHAFCNIDRPDTFDPALAPIAHGRTFKLFSGTLAKRAAQSLPPAAQH